jgi:acetyl-CoA C-acetyltransferase
MLLQIRDDPNKRRSVIVSEAVIVSGARTAIANFGGALQDIPAAELAATAIKGAMKKIALRPVKDPGLDELAPKPLQSNDLIELERKYYDWDKAFKEVNIDEVIIGNVLQTGQGQNPGRQAAIFAGINKESPAYTINKLCASGMKAVALATQSIWLDEAEIVVAGGTENMSATPYYFPKARWGARMFNVEMVDALIHDGLLESFYNYHMGMTAENIAEKYHISRTEQDEFSLASNQKALAAIKSGVLKEEIVPVGIKVKKEVKIFDIDEHPRETTLEALGKLAPVFKKDGTVTAGNSSGITDAGAAVVVMSRERAQKLGLQPVVTIKAFKAAGVDPAYMGLGVVPAVRKIMRQTGLSLDDMGVIELNEAFASQSLGVIQELGMGKYMDRINPYGGGISLGHPLGCTGCRIIITLMYEMQRRKIQYGLATLCIGGGQGMAVILERN